LAIPKVYGRDLINESLKGADGQVYAIAQGSLVVNGLSASGQDGSRVTVNNPALAAFPTVPPLSALSAHLLLKAMRWFLICTLRILLPPAAWRVY